MREKYARSITHELETRDYMDQTEDINTNILKCLDSAAMSVLPKMKKRKNVDETWKDDEQLNQLINQRNEFQRGSDEYKVVTKAIKRRVNYLRNEKLEREANDLNEYASRREVEQLYSSFKSDNSSFKEHRPKRKCDPSVLREYFQKHFTADVIHKDPIELESAPEFIETLQNISTNDIKTGPPDESEIINVVKKLKDGKSASDVPTIFIKCALDCSEFKAELVRLFATIWLTKACPRNWGHSKLVTLWKGPTKGKADDPSTYRGLQIGSSLCKIMIIIIINRFKAWYDMQLSDQQQGFRSARGTTDGIFIAKSIQQITSKMEKPTYLLFVDLSAAFDHVERGWLFETIKKRFPSEFNPTLVHLMESLYSNTTTALSESPDDIFPLNVGVRQGGPESPMLYNLYMDFAMRVYLDSCKSNGIPATEV